MEFSVGARFLISCEPRQVRVVEILGRDVVVEWPWRSVDPDSQYQWDRTVALPVDRTRVDWFQTPWRLEPRVGLRPGFQCRLSIPPTEVIVREVYLFDQPRDIGWLPRPSFAVVMVAAGEAEDLEDADFTIYFDHAEPIEFSALSHSA